MHLFFFLVCPPLVRHPPSSKPSSSTQHAVSSQQPTKSPLPFFAWPGTAEFCVGTSLRAFGQAQGVCTGVWRFMHDTQCLVSSRRSVDCCGVPLGVHLVATLLLSLAAVIHCGLLDGRGSNTAGHAWHGQLAVGNSSAPLECAAVRVRVACWWR